MIYARADHRRRPYHNRNVALTLTRSVQEFLDVDTCRREEVATEDIEDLLESSQGTRLVNKVTLQYRSRENIWRVSTPSRLERQKFLFTILGSREKEKAIPWHSLPIRYGYAP